MGAQSSSASHSDGTTAAVRTPLHNAAGLCFDDLADSEQAVTAAAFEHLFSGPVPGFGSRLFKVMFGKDKLRASKQEFTTAVHRLVSKDSRQEATYRTYLSVFDEAGRKESDLVAQASTCACRFAWELSRDSSASQSEAGKGPVIDAISKAVSNSSQDDSHGPMLSCAVQWTICNMPGLFDSVHCWVERAVWSSSPQAGDSVPFAMPKCVSSSGAAVSSELLTDDAVWLLSTLLPPCYLGHHKAKTSAAEATSVSLTGASTGGQWNLLYNSQDQGLSLNRFKHHVMDYRGPNICCIRCDHNHTVVLAVDGEWRESSSPWGGPDCVVVQLRPAVQSLVSGSKLFVFNEKTRGIRLGLSVGHDAARPVIHMDESLDKLTLQASQVNPAETLSVLHIEVWGCGGADLQEAQRKQKEWDKKQVEKRRKVKRPGRWEENPDAALLEWGGVHTTSGFQHDRERDEQRQT